MNGLGSRRPPGGSFADDGLQAERTALAWERTSVAMMVAGIVLCRYAADADAWVLVLVGFGQTVAGAGVLVWSGIHYDDLHGPVRQDDGVVHTTGVRLVAWATIVATAAGLVLAVIIATRP